MWRGGAISWLGGAEAFLCAERGHQPYFATDEPRTTAKTYHGGRGKFACQGNTDIAKYRGRGHNEPIRNNIAATKTGVELINAEKTRR